MKEPSDTYSNEKAARRRDEALRRALTTPPQPKPTQNPEAVKPAVAPTSEDKPVPTGEVS